MQTWSFILSPSNHLLNYLLIDIRTLNCSRLFNLKFSQVHFHFLNYELSYRKCKQFLPVVRSLVSLLEHTQMSSKMSCF